MPSLAAFATTQLTARPKVQPRAHGQLVARDPSTGTVLTAATVTIWQPGTSTPVTGTLYDQNGNVVANPFTSDASTGLIVFYMDVPQDVDVNVAKATFTTQTFLNVPVIPDPGLSSPATLLQTGGLLYGRAPNTPGSIAAGPETALMQMRGGRPTWQSPVSGALFENGLRLVSGDLTISSGNLTASGTITATSGFSGQLLTAAQPNVTSLGTLAILFVSGGAFIGTIGGPLCAGPEISATSGDISANRGNGTGYIWLGDGNHYLGFDGANYQMITSNLYVAGGLVITAPSGNAYTAGPYTNDWFRNNVAGQGIYNQVTGRGGFFGSGGLQDYPNAYAYWHQGNAGNWPASQVVGINDTQTLSNKTLSDPHFSPISTASLNASAVIQYGSGTLTLPVPTAGQMRQIKAYGGTITINNPNSGIYGLFSAGYSGTNLSSFTIQNGDSVSMWADGANWWVI